MTRTIVRHATLHGNNRFGKHIRRSASAVQGKGFFSLLSVNLLTQCLGFGTALLVARFLSPTDLGNVRILQSYTVLLVVLGGLGYNTAVLKFCAERIGDEQKHGLLGFAIRRSLASAGVVFGLVVALACGGWITASEKLGMWLAIYATIIPFAVITQLLMSFLQSQKQIARMARIQAIIKLQFFMLIVVSTWLWGFHGLVLATIAAYIAGLVPLLRVVEWRTVTLKATVAPRNFNRMAWVSMVGNGVSSLKAAGLFFILDHCFGNREAIGYFALATIFALGAAQVTSTVQTISTPYFSERSADGNWFSQSLVRNQLRMAALSLCVAIAVYLVAWPLVLVVYGDAYRVSLTFLGILLLKYVVWSSYALIGAGLVGLGRVGTNLLVAALSTTVGLGMTYFLLNRFGLIGAAWAQVIAELVALILMLYFSRLVLHRTFNEATLSRREMSSPASA